MFFIKDKSSLIFSSLVSMILYNNSLFKVVQAAEVCNITVIPSCHPIGSPLGTLCTGYYPVEWNDYPPEDDDDFLVDIVVSYTLLNGFYNTEITLSYLNAMTSGGLHSGLGGSYRFNEVEGNVTLAPGENVTVDHILTLDYSKSTFYTSLVTQIITLQEVEVDGTVVIPICHGHAGFNLTVGQPPEEERLRRLESGLEAPEVPEILEFEKYEIESAEDEDGHHQGEPCSVGIYASCHPHGSPEGTLCTDYIPPSWAENLPSKPEDYDQPITVNYTIVNESPTGTVIDLSAAFVTITAPGTIPDRGGARNMENAFADAEPLAPGDSFVISTVEVMDLSERRRYSALVTAVATVEDTGICHGHDAFTLIAGINSCNNPCKSNSDCTCENHDCSPFTGTCRNLEFALKAREKVGCRNGSGGTRRCPDRLRLV